MTQKERSKPAHTARKREREGKKKVLMLMEASVHWLLLSGVVCVVSLLFEIHFTRTKQRMCDNSQYNQIYSTNKL